jgi:type I restriction enzyme S subunit
MTESKTDRDFALSNFRYDGYDEYESISVDWTNSMPSHWQKGKIKRLFDIQVGKMLQSSRESPSETQLPYLKARHIQQDGGFDTEDLPKMWFSPDEIEKYSLQQGDVLVAEGGDVGRAGIWPGSDEEILYQNAINRIRPIGPDSSRFLNYWLNYLKNQGYIEVICNSATIAHYTAETVENTPLLVPPIEEQESIADFLDYHTSDINELIQRKKSILELLEEKREAFITNTMTKGLNQETIYKSSGIPTIGEIPAHWDVVPNRAIFQEVDNRSEDGSEELLSVSHKTGVTPRSEKDVNMFEADSLEGYKIAQEGDFVINTMWAWMGAVGISPQRGVVSPSYHVYRPNDQALPQFIDYFYRTPPYVTEMGRYSKGVWKSRSRLYPDEFLRMDTILPPIPEQKEIIEEIKKEVKRVDELSSKLAESVEILREKRNALITNAVTGQIDVSDWEPSFEKEATV